MKQRLITILTGALVSLFAFSCAQDKRSSISGYSGTGEKSSTGTGPGLGTETSTGVDVSLGEELEDDDNFVEHDRRPVVEAEEEAPDAAGVRDIRREARERGVLEDEDTNSQFNTSNTERQVDTGILPTEDTNSTYGTRDQSNAGSATGAYPSPRPHRIPRTAE